MNKFKNVLLLTCLFILSACGGGSGGNDGDGVGDPSTPATNTPPTINAGADQTIDEAVRCSCQEVAMISKVQ